ncbi:hypothetical protein ACSBR1_006649 [Camellia fascicularis]
MIRTSAVSRRKRSSEMIGESFDDDVSPSDSHEVHVDLIITDYCMPGMTGYDLLKRIKILKMVSSLVFSFSHHVQGSSSFREIPVVIMSSENVLARIDRCLEEGAEDFILKPVKLSDVKRLKGSMFGDDQVGREDRRINHRNSPEPSDLSSSPSQQSIISPSLSPLSSPSLVSSPNSSPLSLLSLPSLAPPCSRTLLDSSPSRPLEITNCDDDLE